MENEKNDAEIEIRYENLNISKGEVYRDEINQLLVRLSQYSEIKEYLPYIAIFPLVDSANHYGEAVSCNMLGISSRALDNISTKGELGATLSNMQIPNKILDCLIVHECLHIIFSESFQYLYTHNKERLSHFVTTVIPDSLMHHRPFGWNNTFIQEKQYRSIAGSGYTPNLSLFLNNYFGALQKDMIYRGFQGMYILPFNSAPLFAEYQQKSPETIETLYQKDPEGYIQKYLTGIKCCKIIEDSQKSFEDLYEEEGFVNYLAGLITGVDVVHEMNRYFPQDPGKLANIAKLQNRNLTKEDCLAQVKTRKNISKLYT